MQMSSSIFFMSSNKNKFHEAKNVMSKFGLRLKFFKFNLEEIQADSIEEIAKHKVTQAFSICSKPVMVEDDGLFIKSLKGFPGPYSSFVFNTIGNKGILRLLSRQRTATFRSVIAYCENEENIHIFDGAVNGKISNKEIGSRWGFDPIFIPDGKNKTFSQLHEKNQVSHRYIALKKFANWYQHKK